METINTDKEQPRYDNDNVTLSPLVLYWTEGYVIVSTEIPLPSDGFLFDLLEPWDVRALSIWKTADLPLQLWAGTFSRFMAIRFYFLSKTLI